MFLDNMLWLLLRVRLSCCYKIAAGTMKPVLFLLILSIVLTPSFAPSGALSNSALRFNKTGTSLNWSGYVVETSLTSPQKGAVTDVKGTWILPSVHHWIMPYAASCVWIGIDGNSSIEQVGTDSDYCQGTPTYYAWYEMYPNNAVMANLKISPGDKISAEVKYLGQDNFRLMINDTTTGKSFSTTQKAPAAQESSAEWIVEAPSYSWRILSLANFGTVTFTNAQATLNGHTGTISDAAWKYDAVTMTTSSGTVKAQESTLSSSGTSFSVIWHNL